MLSVFNELEICRRDEMRTCETIVTIIETNICVLNERNGCHDIRTHFQFCISRCYDNFECKKERVFNVVSGNKATKVYNNIFQLTSFSFIFFCRFWIWNKKFQRSRNTRERIKLQRDKTKCCSTKKTFSTKNETKAFILINMQASKMQIWLAYITATNMAILLPSHPQIDSYLGSHRFISVRL